MPGVSGSCGGMRKSSRKKFIISANGCARMADGAVSRSPPNYAARCLREIHPSAAGRQPQSRKLHRRRDRFFCAGRIRCGNPASSNGDLLSWGRRLKVRASDTFPNKIWNRFGHQNVQKAHKDRAFRQRNVVGQASRLSLTLNFRFGMRVLRTSPRPLKSESIF